MRDTAHLSWLEDCAYRRLLDAYYVREKPLPVEVRECYKLARATSKQEREAVDYVLREFFMATDDGHHQARADAEIARFQNKSRKAKASADARWSKQSQQSEGSAEAMRTHSEGSANGMHRAPVPRHQTPDTNTQNTERATTPTGVACAREPDAEGHEPTQAGSVCRAMREAGMQAANPGDPRLLELLRQGATQVEFEGLAREGAAKGKGWAWVLVTLAARRADAAAIALAPPVPSAPAKPSDADRTAEYLRERARPMTDEEKAAADEARKRAMAALRSVA